MDSLITKHRQLLANLNVSFRRPFIDQVHWTERMVGIKGARGVGKTTLCLQYISENYGISPECLYVSMDNVYYPFSSLLELAEEFWQRGGKHLFIDEIHKYPNWIPELKNIYDSYPDLRVVFTGSSVLQLDNSVADLSRRVVLQNMQGLSFREFIENETGKKLDKYSLSEILKSHESIAYEIVSQIKPFKYFEEYLRIGYYPYYLQNKETYSIKLSQMINQIIETDLPHLSRIELEQINKLKRLLFILSESVPFKPNLTKIGKLMQLSRQTVSNYIHLLAKAGLLWLLYSDRHQLNTLSKPEKLFLQHPNYYYALSYTDLKIGSIRETFFVNQLSESNRVETSEIGDFKVNGKYLFEIGGKSKGFKQIAKQENSFLATDDTEIGIGNKIPLWLFGFLY